jgi:hypothetical protein
LLITKIDNARVIGKPGQPVSPVSLGTESDSRSRDNLECLKDSLQGKISTPYIYLRAHDRLRVTQSSKNTKYFTFLSTNPNSLPNPNFLAPLIPATLGGGFNWPADARSIQCASSPTESLPGGSSLVQAVEAVHTGITNCAYQFDWSELRRPEGSARGRVRV